MAYSETPVTLHDPERRNCLSQSLLLELTHTLGALGADPEIAVIILTGSVESFCTGMDIKDLQSLPKKDIIKISNVLQETVADIKQPIIAAVSGHVLGGGCELALMCDITMCTDQAVFGFPEVKLGLIPGGGGTQRLAQVVGRQRAMEVILTGRSWTAAEAVAWGMASRTFTSYEFLMEAVLSCAGSIAKNGQKAVRAAKQILKPPNESGLGNLVSVLKAEKELFGQLLGSDEQISLCNAFLSRKKQPIGNRISLNQVNTD